MGKFKVGDKVKIIYVGSISSKRELFGKIATIACVYSDDITYSLQEYDWMWSDLMLEPFNQIKVGDHVTVRNDLVIGNKYGCQHFVHSMKPSLGQTFIVNKVLPEDPFTLELDSKGSSNGWAIIKFGTNKWRYATEQEKLMYDSKGRPYDVSSLVDGTTGKQSLIIKGPTVNYETVKKEGVYPIQTPLIIKTKRKPKKNKNLIIL